MFPYIVHRVLYIVLSVPVTTISHIFLGRWIFWSDYNSETRKIVRMNMDGTNSTIFVEGNILRFPNGLSLDYNTETLFWVDAGTDEIGRVGIDGTRRRIVANLTKFHTKNHPFSIEYYNENLYFGDWLTDTIRRLTFTSNMDSSETNLSTEMEFPFSPTNIRVIDINRQPGRSSGSKFIHGKIQPVTSA